MSDISLQPTSLNALQDQSLKMLSGVFAIDKAASYLVDQRLNPVCFKFYQVQPGMHRDYVEHYHQFDPQHPNNVASTDTEILRTNDLVALNERPHHPYYTEFMRPWGIQDTVDIYLRHDDKLVATFSLFLSPQQSDFLDKEHAKLKHLHEFMQFSLEQCLSSPQQESLESFCQRFGLTAKESMVVEQVIQGLPNKRIASNLCCSLATVKTHLQHIFAKLGVNSKAEITSLLYQFAV